MKTKPKNTKPKNKTTFTQLIRAKRDYEKARKLCDELHEKYNKTICDSTHLTNKICSIGRKKFYVKINVEKGLYFNRPEISFNPVNE
jgi:hypothetical protein